MQVLGPAGGYRIRAAVLCSDGQTCCAWGGLSLSLLWLFLLFRAKSRWANEPGVWVPASLPTSIAKPWSELAQHPPVLYQYQVNTLSCLFLRARWRASRRDGSLSWDRSWGTLGTGDPSVSVLRCPGGDGIAPIRAKSWCCFAAQIAEEGCVLSLCLHRCAAFL